MNNPYFPKGLLAAGLLAVLAAYSAAWSGTLHYDDEINLGGLQGISDAWSAIEFIFTGASGPTGRPIALATFAMQHASWPDPEPFLIFNTLLHLVNALLCFMLVRNLARLAGEPAARAQWMSVFITLLWAASPFIAGSSLMIVQRMTGLSAFFVLLFINVYLLLRPGYSPNSVWSNAKLVSTLAAGTLLAGFSKENGFLLPVFVLLIESLLITSHKRQPEISRLNSAVKAIFLIAPTVLIVCFLAYKGFTTEGYQLRDFSLYERVLTQYRAIVDYIINLVVPNTTEMSPFHDNYKKSEELLEPVSTLIDAALVFALAGAAVYLRKKAPLIAFGLGWFFVGHIMESTVLPLELYYPHRNYIPAIGLYIALGYGAYEILRHSPIRPLAYKLGAVALVCVFMATLALGATLWGDKNMSAEMWYIYNRDSERAARYLYRFYYRNGEIGVARQLNENFVEDFPESPMIAIESLTVCESDRDRFRIKIDRAAERIGEAQRISLPTASALEHMADTASQGLCPHFSLEDVDRLLDRAIRDDPEKIAPLTEKVLLTGKARIAYEKGNFDQSLAMLQAAYNIKPSLDLALFIAEFHLRNKDKKAAIQFLQNQLHKPPKAGMTKLIREVRIRRRLNTLSGETG